MQAEPLFEWSEPLLHLVEFVGAFLTIGAVGFRYSALRAGTIGEPDATVYGDAAKRAAVIGVVGALINVVRLVAEVLPGTAARRHMGVMQVVTSDLQTGLLVAFTLLALVGFALAAARSRAGWALAAVGVLGASLRGLASAVTSGRWAGLVNPIHVLAAGLWIGTLFVMVVAGIAPLLRATVARDRRGAIAADMVNRFSPLALTMGGVVVLFGLITAWRHLKTLPALWTTPYGYALIAKLCVVAVVFALGAWNWRRQRPQLGSEGGAVAIRRSSTSELVAAGVVLLITAVLVSIPAPRAPGAPPPGTPPGAQPAAPAAAPKS